MNEIRIDADSQRKQNDLSPFKKTLDTFTPHYNKISNLRKKYTENAVFMKEKLIINKIKRRMMRDKNFEQADNSVRSNQNYNSYEF